MRISAPVGTPTEPAHAPRRRQRVDGHLVARLGHAVGLQHRHAEVRLDPRHQLRARARSCRSARSAAARRRRPAALDPLEQHLVERRAGGEPGDAGARRAAARTRCGAKRARHDHACRPPTSGAKRRGDEAVHVEERHRAVRHVVGAEAVVRGDRPRGGHQVAVEQRHLLGPAGGAARVQEQRDVVRLRPGSKSCARAHDPAARGARRPRARPRRRARRRRARAARRAAPRSPRRARAEQPRAQVLQVEGELGRACRPG